VKARVRSRLARVVGRPARRVEAIAPPEPEELPALFASIGIDCDYSALDLADLTVDTQGWGSFHPIFADVFRVLRPRVVIEVGTWKGASLLHMHELGRTFGCETRFVCIDTWLGSNDSIWLDPHDRRHLMLRGGYPTMFRQFVFNLLEHDAADDVFPLPMTSTTAARVLRRLGVVADAIYLDAGHEEEELAADLRLYYDLLRPGGALFGDDFDERWPGVMRAANSFSRRQGLELGVHAKKWIVWKP